MACANPADVLRQRTEDLSEILYLRASWRDPVLSMIPRGSYPKGAGYVRSTFTIGRSEPTSDEETWAQIGNIADRDNEGDAGTYSSTMGACNVTYNATDVGFKEDTYEPEVFGLSGPLICQDDLAVSFNSEAFWEKYFQALEKRNARSISNRQLNVYMQYVPKAPANSSFTWYAGDYATQIPPSAVDLSSMAADLPTSELTQEMLDDTARVLMEEGASDPNTNGWITFGDDGPEFPLYIGAWASKRLKLNNSELRSDINQSFQGRGDINPVLKRLGSSYTLGNFRHIINLFPPRWSFANGVFTRVPVWTMSSSASYATKGKVAVINPNWVSATTAPYEAAIVMNPWVMTEEVLLPVNSLNGANLNPQNYYGEWTYVTGNDALLGMDSCTGKQDPLKKMGRHFAEYRHANKPVFPSFGRLILFKRCADAFDTITCS